MALQVFLNDLLDDLRQRRLEEAHRLLIIRDENNNVGGNIINDTPTNNISNDVERNTDNHFLQHLDVKIVTDNAHLTSPTPTTNDNLTLCRALCQRRNTKRPSPTLTSRKNQPLKDNDSYIMESKNNNSNSRWRAMAAGGRHRGGLLSRQESDSCLIKPKRNKKFLLCTVSPTGSSSRSMIKTIQRQQRPTFLLEKQCSDSALILPKRTLSPKKQQQQQKLCGKKLGFGGSPTTVIAPPNLHLSDDNKRSSSPISSTTTDTALETHDSRESDVDGDAGHCTKTYTNTNVDIVSPSQAQRYMISVNFHQLRYHQQYRRNHQDVMRSIRQGLAFFPSSTRTTPVTIIESVKEEGEPSSDDKPPKNEEESNVVVGQEEEEDNDTEDDRDSNQSNDDGVRRGIGVNNQSKLVNSRIVETAQEVLQLCLERHTELKA